MPRPAPTRWRTGFRALRRRRWPFLAGLALGLLLLALWLVRPFWQLSGQFASDRRSQAAGGWDAQPSRLYGKPLLLSAGATLPRSEVMAELKALEYRAGEARAALRPGSYREGKERLEIQLRSFPTPEGIHPGGSLVIDFQGRRVKSLSLGGHALERTALEPPLLASYMGPRFLERRPVRVEELPDHLVRAVLAAEDDEFFRHAGLSPTGIARATWRNLRGRAVVQGGSTLTQQLVKNLYLTHERTWARKTREALLAVLLELRYTKRQILQAYLNEIYLGQSGGVNLIGIGAAARAYFGEDAARLDLAQAAVLAGMIASPGDYSPLAHPEKARTRRDWVLERLRELRWVEPKAVEAALAAPLATAPQRVIHRRAPYFADAMAGEAARRFGIAQLADRGYTLFATLSWRDQQKAEEAVAWGIEQLEKGWQKGRPGRLQAALVSVDPRSGEILAYLGGRSYKESQFDRAGQARRQAGSAFKPVVYAAAFENGVATPATLLEDAPLTVTLTNAVWTPRNDDESFRGWVTARQAIEDSLNVPTARLALEVGLRNIVATARRMGVTSPLQPVPSLALGAFEVSPVELATVYATLANGGLRPSLHGLTAVVDAQGRVLTAEPPAEPEPALSPQAAFIVNAMLQGVLDRGTGAAVRGQGVRDALAGKTGTTNGRRDSWFGGYAPSRTTMVWVGYDDNSATRLSGARGALPIWARFTAGVRPAGGFPMFPQPRGVVTAVVDPWSGGLATEACPEILTEVFLEDQVPNAVCHLHGGWFADILAPIPGAPPGSEEARPAEPGEYGDLERPRSFRRWLRKVFGKERDERPRRWRNPPAPQPPPPPP